MAVEIGVLAIQGDVSEHILSFRMALEKKGLKGTAYPVRTKEELRRSNAFVLPGGESTTLSHLIEKSDLTDAIRHYEGGIFATCAGMVLMATDVPDPRIHPLGLLDMTVDRNAFGRQRESFEAEIAVEGLNGTFHAVFIRAPVATRVGPGIRVLARTPEGAVGVQKGRKMAFAFHPELTHDLRLHERFLQHLES